jgi:hypothetical protein
MVAREMQAMLKPEARPCLGKLLIAPHVLGINKHVFRCERHALVTQQVNTTIQFVDYDVWSTTKHVIPVVLQSDMHPKSLSSRMNRPPKRRRGRGDEGPPELGKLLKW